MALELRKIEWVLRYILIVFVAGLFACAVSLYRQSNVVVEASAVLAETETVALDLTALKSELGFNGFIHDFKNYLLRGEKVYSDRFADGAREANTYLDRLGGVWQGRFAGEAEVIRSTVASYVENIAVIDTLREEGRSIAEIDAAVRVDDTPAADALSHIANSVEAAVVRARTGLDDAQSMFRLLGIAMTAAALMLLILTGTYFYMRAQISRADARDRKEFQRYHELIERMFETVSSSILALDRNGRIVMLNGRAREQLGLQDATVPISWPAGITFAAGDGSALDAGQNPLERTLSGARIEGETFRLRHDSDPAVHFVRFASAEVDDPGQTPIRVVVALDDVTREEKNRQSLERTGRLEALGQLTGGIAHDFNNLLSTMLGSIQLARRTGVEERRNENLLIAEKAIRMATELTGRLLAFAKQQPGRVQRVNIAELIDDICTIAEHASASSIAIRRMLDDNALHAECDRGLLENAILNLIINARDAISESGKGNRITVGAREVTRTPAQSRGRSDTARRVVRITVSDNGPGMSEEVRQRAVDPFFSTRTREAGSGLGLSTVYGFVEQANGEMRIYSEPGVGTTVALLLPLSVTAEEELPSADLTNLKLGDAQQILIVDDNPSLLEVTEMMVQELGYHTVSAQSAEAALDLLSAGEKVDAILTDIVMSGGADGFSLAEQAIRLRPKMPIAYMSGYTGFADHSEARVAGPFLQKPWGIDELADALSQIVPQPGQNGRPLS